MDTFKIAVSDYKLTQKIPAGHSFWQEFNGSFTNLELEPEHILQAVYEGRSITTWLKAKWRTSENYQLGQHIGLDFDAGDKTSSLSYLSQEKFFSKYGSFAYTTMSHTEEHPRTRLIFLLDQPIQQAKNYVLAVSSLLWLYGTADRSCRDAVRFFYGSPKCECEYLNNILPLEVVKKLIQTYQESGAQERRHTAKSDYHAPASQQEVQEALSYIKPWSIDYDEWVAVLMGIHSQFGDAGLPLAASWGDGKPGEVEDKWKSFHNNGNIAGAVTIATVFGIAKQFGWKKQQQLVAA